MKVNDGEKQQHYDQKIKSYEENIRKLQKLEPVILKECRKTPANAAEKLFTLADKMLNLASNYMAINGICRSILNLREEESLNEARKAISKAIIYMENIVTGKVDVPFSEYEKNLAELSTVNSEKKYYMARKIGAAIDLLKFGYGNNTKWRWSFVDIEARFTIVVKNLLDLKQALSGADPSSPDYTPMLYHIRLIKDLLSQQAARFQERYSLVSKSISDIEHAMSFLSVLRNLHSLLGEKFEVEETKKKYNVLLAVHEAEINKKHSQKN
jgi:hypothetical protein